MIEYLFPTPIYTHLPKRDEIWFIQEEIKKILPEIREKDRFEHPAGWEDPVQSNINHRYNTILDYKMQHLYKYIEKHTSEYITAMNPFLKRDLKMHAAWVNITDKGESQEWHTHTDAYISGVYYYQTSGKDGRLGFRNPVPFGSLGLFPVGGVMLEKEFFIPQNGALILFPGWLEHKVEVNTTDEERITIAFNWLARLDETEEGLIKP